MYQISANLVKRHNSERVGLNLLHSNTCLNGWIYVNNWSQRMNRCSFHWQWYSSFKIFIFLLLCFCPLSKSPVARFYGKSSSNLPIIIIGTENIWGRLINRGRFWCYRMKNPRKAWEVLAFAVQSLESWTNLIVEQFSLCPLHLFSCFLGLWASRHAVYRSLWRFRKSVLRSVSLIWLKSDHQDCLQYW